MEVTSEDRSFESKSVLCSRIHEKMSKRVEDLACKYDNSQLEAKFQAKPPIQVDKANITRLSL